MSISVPLVVQEKMELEQSLVRDNFSANIEVVGNSVAVVYAIFLIFVYIASKFTEVVRLDNDNPYTKDYLEKYGFFTYIYLGGTVYITYILAYVVKKRGIRAVENTKVRCTSKYYF